MSQTPAIIPAVDPEQLMPDQVRQLRFVLSVLSLHQLVQVAARVKQICEAPGFGRTHITVEKGHPSTMGNEDDGKFPAEISAEKLEALMGER